MLSWSWLESQNSPELGSFTLHWFGDSCELEVWRDGDLWWTSGELRNGEFELLTSLMNSSRFVTVLAWFQMRTKTPSVTITVPLMIKMLDQSGCSTRIGSFMMLINYNISIARAGDCDGYNTDGGCRTWRGRDTGYCPLGSLANDFELIKNGSFKAISMDMSINSTWLDTNQSRYGSGHHCKATCWMDCDCLGFDFLYDNQTGCRFWNVKNSQLLEDPDSSATKYIKPGLITAKLSLRNNDALHKWIWIGIATVAVLLALVLCSMCYLIRRRKLAGKLVTEQEMAIKRLSKHSGQGVSEFKNELILIYELQHTNLVQLFRFCIAW